MKIEWKPIIIVGAIIIFSGLAMRECSRERTRYASSSVNTTTDQTTQQRNTPVIDKPYIPPKPNFEISDYSWYTEGDYVVYNVEVLNNTSDYVDHVRVGFNTYDKNGKLMASDWTYVRGLSPGGKKTCKGYMTKFGPEHKGKAYLL